MSIVMSNYPSSMRSIRGVCLAVDAGAAQATVNLALLKAVDLTVDALCSERRLFGGLLETAEGLKEDLGSDFNRNAKVQLDPDAIATDVCEKAEQHLNDYRRILTFKMQSAKDDPALHDDLREAVIDAYEQTIRVVIDLGRVLNEIRWAVMEHDADFEPPTGPATSNVDEFLRNLKLT